MTDIETPDEQFLILPEVGEESSSRGKLEKLKEDIESQMSTYTIGRLAEYCRNEKIDSAAWATDELNQEQLYEIEDAFDTVDLGLNILDFLEKEPDTDEYKYAKAVMNLIVDKIDAYEKEHQAIEESLDTVNSDTISGALGEAAGKIKESFADNPILTSIAVGFTALAAYQLWGSEFALPFTEEKKPWFKMLGLGALGVWTGNFLTESLTDKSLWDHAQELLNQEEMDDKMFKFLEGREDLEEVNRQSLQHMWAIGSIPFSAFYKAYKHARKNHKNEIDMRSIRNTAMGRRLPSKYFTSRHSKAMYQELEGLIGNRYDDFEDNYLNNPPETGTRGYYSLREVIVIEEGNFLGDDGEAAEEGDSDAPKKRSDKKRNKRKKRGSSDKEDAGGSGGSPSQAVRAGAEAAPAAIVGSFETELPQLFKDLNAELSVGPKQAVVMGFPFTYSFSESTTGTDITQHLLKPIDSSAPFAFTVREDMEEVDRQDLEAEYKSLRAYLEKAMKALFVGTSLGATYNPKWDPDNNRWVVSPSYEVNGEYLELELILTPEGGLRVKYNDREAKTITELLPDIMEEKTIAALSTQLAATEEAQFMKGIKIESVNLTGAVKTASLAGGATFDFVKDPATGTYLINNLKMGSRFVDKLVARATNQELAKAFQEVDDSLEDKAYWNLLVPFKKKQILNAYRRDLMEVSERSSIQLKDVHDVFSNRVLDKTRELKDLANDLVGHSGAARKPYEAQFLRFGLGRDYSDAFAEFHDYANELDFAGLGTKGSKKHNELLFMVLEVWYEKTDHFQNQNEFLPNHRTYIRDLNEVFRRELGQGLKKKQGILWDWTSHPDDRLTKEKLMEALPQVKAFPPYEEKYTELSETLTQTIPVLHGLSGYTVEHPAPNTARIIFNKGTSKEVVWEFDTSTPTPTAIKFELGADVINFKVFELNNENSFTQPFDRLRNVFAGMESNLKGRWDQLIALDFGGALEGEILDEKWTSMVDYKQDEAELHYRLELMDLMQKHAAGTLTDAQLATETDKVDTYYRSTYPAKMQRQVTLVNQMIESKLQPGATDKYFTRDEFDQLYKSAAEVGYGSAEYQGHMWTYRQMMDRFDFSGSERLGKKSPENIRNAFVLVHERYTSGLRDEKANWGKVHDAYMQYIRIEAMTAVRNAFENGDLATGHWLDRVIGIDEVPRELSHIMPFDKFNERFGRKIEDQGEDFEYDPIEFNDLCGLLKKMCEEDPDNCPVTPDPDPDGGGGGGGGGGGTAPPRKPGDITEKEAKEWIVAFDGQLNQKFDAWEKEMKAGLAAGTHGSKKKVTEFINRGEAARDTAFHNVVIEMQPTQKNLDDLDASLASLKAACE
ncbi:hypothetical protein HN680_05870, partial [Candidatus Peregrinibacteria bacterium]|nr:hypothetical protein [Candidatus Peregrinibacteria bacterium]